MLTLQTSFIMKKITLLLGMLSFTFIAFSQDCPLFFKRNNGNAGGCTAELTFYYASCPISTYVVTAILDDNGVPIPGITFTASTCLNGQVDVCITSGNIPPAVVLSLQFCIPETLICYNCFLPEGGPTPVKLSAFFAKRNKNTIALSWNTEAELNAKEFVVERKSGNTWIPVSTVQASNKSTGSSYTITDQNSNKGVSQYRLKVIDAEGSYTYSDIRTVKGNSTVSDFTIFPNPSTGNTKVTISDISEPTDVQVVDNSGRILKNVSMNNSNTVELNNLQKGMYMIRIVNKNSGETLTKKLTVVAN